jgi:hypothetical protein
MLPLLLELPDWQIPWAGIGALLMGLGSFFSGFAAYRVAMRKEDDEQKPQTSDGNH